MFKKISENKVIILIVVFGLIIAGIVSSAILSANQTIKVWVPSRTISAGTIVTQDMIKQVDVPTKMVGGFIENRNLIVGYRLKNTVDANQLFYPNDFIAAWESYSQDADVPEDFVITSVQIPNERACGGLIVAGDTVDIYAVRKSGSSENKKNLINGGVEVDTEVFYVLSNVKIINTNSALSQSQDYELNDILDAAAGGGQFYIMALSYDDVKKLRQAEGSASLWLNIAPRQNSLNEPLLAQMVGQSWSGLHDAQEQVANPDGTPIDGVSQFNQEKMEIGTGVDTSNTSNNNNLNSFFDDIYNRYQENEPGFTSEEQIEDFEDLTREFSEDFNGE